jgi:hypothetical protein
VLAYHIWRTIALRRGLLGILRQSDWLVGWTVNAGNETDDLNRHLVAFTFGRAMTDIIIQDSGKKCISALEPL